MISYDQLNVPSLAAAEQLIRWLVQLEVATERHHRAPDFTGLGLILGGPVTTEGRAITAKFNEHLTAQLKTRAQIWKNERLYREEKRHLAGSYPGRGSAAADQKGDSKGGKGKAKQKAKSSGKGGKPQAATAADDQ